MMIKRTHRKFIVTAGVALFILPLMMPAVSFAEEDGEHDYHQTMRDEMQNTDDFDATLEGQQKSVMQQLEELKEKTKVTHKPLVNQEDAPYFKVEPEEPPVMDEPALKPNYTYKKKSQQTTPSRSFNNVR